MTSMVTSEICRQSFGVTSEIEKEVIFLIGN